MSNTKSTDNFLTLPCQLLEASEQAAIAASHWVGKGNETEADRAAVNAMREALNSASLNGTVVIGEGERDKAPMLYIGEKVGSREGPNIDIALDPLEGTTICANDGPNSMAVIAMANEGCFLNAPDIYMEKIAAGVNSKQQLVDLDNSPKENIANVAKYKRCSISDLVVVILDRPRHKELIAKSRETGARVQLISDGDIAGIISTTNDKIDADIYMGIGGAPEGVLAAAALKTFGGQMFARLKFKDESERSRAKSMGVYDLDKQYSIEGLAAGDVLFCASGVTDGWMLQGIKESTRHIVVNSLLLNSKNKSVKNIVNTISK
jgi:fructose-1,6-bisphosphatase II / sedoheptulose-1,7-bisphosphatase